MNVKSEPKRSQKFKKWIKKFFVHAAWETLKMLQKLFHFSSPWLQATATRYSEHILERQGKACM